MNGLHDGVRTQLAPSQGFKALSHPNSRREKCPVQPTVWVRTCCWLVTLLKGGVNLFLNWVWNNHDIDWYFIWWSWKCLDFPQLALYHSFMTVLRYCSSQEHISSSGKEHATPFCVCPVACGLVAKVKMDVARSESAKASLERRMCKGLLEAEAPSLCSIESVSSLIFSYTESHFSPLSSSFSFSNSTWYSVGHDDTLIVQLRD